MDCHSARDLMHEALDERRVPEGALREHLDRCAECGARFEELRHAESEASSALRAPAAEERLDRATRAALARMAPVPVGRRSVGLAVAACAGLLLFAAGALLGREAWPRVVVREVPGETRVVERVVEKPVTVEVRVPVPVYRERRVVRVVREPVAGKPTPDDGPVRAKVVIAQSTSIPAIEAPTFHTEYEAARTVGEPEAFEALPAPAVGGTESGSTSN
jgi:anti-sigma factor RsiW